MKRIALSVLASVLIFAATSYAPPVHALPQFSTLIDYYDHSLTNVGTSFRNCAGSLQTSGTLAGEWKEITYTDCQTFDQTYEVWHYCSGTWVKVAYLGDPSC
jgi:hypothetical protein